MTHKEIKNEKKKTWQQRLKIFHDLLCLPLLSFHHIPLRVERPVKENFLTGSRLKKKKKLILIYLRRKYLISDY